MAAVIEDGKWAKRRLLDGVHCQYGSSYGDSRTIATCLDAKAQTPSRFDVDHDRLYMKGKPTSCSWGSNSACHVLELAARSGGVDTSMV